MSNPPLDEKSVQAFAKIMNAVPHLAETGITLVSLEKGKAVMRLAYDPQFIGYPDTGILAGGIIFTLMDTAAGTSVYARLGQYRPIATLDLRLDYLRPATAGKDVYAHAECYRTTRTVAFVRATACHDGSDEPIAHATGTFMFTDAEVKQE